MKKLRGADIFAHTFVVTLTKVTHSLEALNSFTHQPTFAPIMHSLSYILILCSAVIHASWNALAKHIDGNLPALVMAEFVGSLMLFPFIFITRSHLSP